MSGPLIGVSNGTEKMLNNCALRMTTLKSFHLWGVAMKEICFFKLFISK
jgi:hypothetical protein